MRPLDAFPVAARRLIRAVLVDIDETLTTKGRLTASAYGAMERLHGAGFKVVPITGRPAGWCDHIARMWPVDAVVGENGAFYFRYDHGARRFTKHFLMTAEERAQGRRKLGKLREKILKEVPGTAVASDQPYRESDLAIDYCEDVKRLSPKAVERIVAIFTAAGATARVSSVHVNGWYGDYDKLAMTRTMLEECFAIDAGAAKELCVFVGDSPNDAPMFAFFPNAVGVANVRDFKDQLTATPAYVTPSRAGAGFAELAAALIAAKE
ncbi:MAG: HAD-IIB family hydrolase [Rhodospirillales bacterium]